MASQLYSRYIPPKKQKVSSDSTAASVTEQPFAAEVPIRPSTQTDASATYSRYIPPSSKPKTNPVTIPISSPPQLLSPISKRKRVEKIDTFTAQESSRKKSKSSHENSDEKLADATEYENIPAESSEAQNEQISESVSKTKRKKRRVEAEEEEEGRKQAPDKESLLDENSRHKSVLLKREKSLKKTEKLARKAALQAAEGGEVEEEVAEDEPQELHPLEPLPQPEPIAESTGPKFSALPDWLASPIRVSAKAKCSFESIGVPTTVIESLQTAGFKDAFAVQSAVLPLLMPREKFHRGDVLVSAATGSGKTLAYVLPMVADICSTTVTRLRGLIIMPTRELVFQAREVCETCATAYHTVDKRRRLNINVAVGNQTLKTEQAGLMDKQSSYAPEEYRNLEAKINSVWKSPTQDIDGKLLSNADDLLSAEPDHIIRYSSKVDILICTPGRLVEHLRSTPGFTLDHLKWLVIDEADKLLDQSFQQWLQVVMAGVSQKPVVRGVAGLIKVVLSATMTKDIGQLTDLKLQRPHFVVLDGEVDGEDPGDEKALSLPATLKESAVKIEDENDKPLYLLHVLRLMSMFDNPSVHDTSSSSVDEDSSDEDSSDDSNDSDDSSTSSASSSKALQKLKPNVSNRGVLIFTRSNENALRLSRLVTLMEPGSKIGTLTSTIPNSVRKATLHEFQAGKLSILVASDLVARGLDLPDLAMVINYDMPASLNSYVHRVGRTARAGKEGNAWTFFTTTEGRWFWHEIARSESVLRKQKVERMNISKTTFSEEMREKYELALEKVGREARSA